MKITVLGATGATGRELVGQALERGHEVTAVARDPTTLVPADSGRLTTVAADVHDQAAMADALRGATVVVSGLGNTSGPAADVLATGARAAVDAGVPRLVWLGALGTGATAEAAGGLTRSLLRLALREQLSDKAAADRLVLDHGGVAVHAGPLTKGPRSEHRRVVAPAAIPHKLFPRRVSRATVAAAMLDLAERSDHSGETLAVLTR